MPIYEYECGDCQTRFETLVRGGQSVACPSCGGVRLERLVSRLAIATAGTRQQSYLKARASADRVRRDRAHAHDEYVKKHHDDHER